MNDQATTLRNMATAAPGLNPNSLLQRSRIARNGATRLARTIAVTSGKGGVGKSNFAVNVALELAARGRQISLLDADLALANADVLLGLNPQFHLGHVLAGQRTLEEVVLAVGQGVRLIPGGSGIEELANLSLEQHKRLIAELCAMEECSDFMIVDTAAGIAGNVIGVLRAATEVVIVTTPDPTAVVDAYATIKVLHQHAPQKLIWIVVNDVVGVGDAEQVFTQLATAAQRFLNRRLNHLGTVPRDSQLAEAVREQTPVVDYAPDAPASRALRLIAKQLDAFAPSEPAADGDVKSFWNAFAEVEA